MVAASVMFPASMISGNKIRGGYSAAPARCVSWAGRFRSAGENLRGASVLARRPGRIGAPGRALRSIGPMAGKWRFSVGRSGGVGLVLSVWFWKLADCCAFAGERLLIGNLSRPVPLAAYGGGGGAARAAGSPPLAGPRAYSTRVDTAGLRIDEKNHSGRFLARLSRISFWLRVCDLAFQRETQSAPMGSGVWAAREMQVKERLARRPFGFLQFWVGVQNWFSGSRMVKGRDKLCLPVSHVN